MNPVLPLFWNLPAPQVLTQPGSAPQGLSTPQAEQALARFGPNTLQQSQRLPSCWQWHLRVALSRNGSRAIFHDLRKYSAGRAGHAPGRSC